MDRQDFAILHALTRHPRATYGEVGDAVGLTANAVKARVQRLLADGVLQGFAAVPHPSRLGLREGLLLFTGVDDADEREDEILRGLAEVPGVRATDVGLDHTVCVWLLYADDDDWERIERATVSLVGKPPSRATRAVATAEPPAPLAPADWKILRALQHDGRAHIKDLVARSGLTFKPLKRRLDAMLRAGDARILPVVSPAEASGTLLFRVVCFLAEGAPAPVVPDAIVTFEAPGVASVLAQRANLREARALVRSLRDAPGVERAMLQIATRRASCSWLDDTLARLATPVPAPARAPVPVPRAR